MFLALVVIVLSALLVSGFCSLMEAALFAVPIHHAKYLADKGSKRGKMLLAFKEDLSRPIAAILILNTIANTVGAALAGAIVAIIYGEEAVIVFSLIFTLLILYVSEIIPKQIGAIHARKVSAVMTVPLYGLIRALFPLVFITNKFSRMIGRGASFPSVSEEEVLSLTELGREEGVIDHLEGSVIKNIVGLDRLLVKDILTPRIVVFRLRKDLTIGEVQEDILNWSHTRVPIFDAESPDTLDQYVIQRDLFRALLRGEGGNRLESIARPLTVVPELMRADKLLLQMFEKRESICSVVDEHGSFAGLVTLEDTIEEIVGREIVDEYDLVGDLRSYARVLFQARKRRDAHQQEPKSDTKEKEES